MENNGWHMKDDEKFEINKDTLEKIVTRLMN